MRGTSDSARLNSWAAALAFHILVIAVLGAWVGTTSFGSRAAGVGAVMDSIKAAAKEVERATIRTSSQRGAER